MKSLTLIAILTLSAASFSLAVADSPIAPTIIAPPLTSSVPPLINYQGTLTDDNGVPIPDGPRKLEFNLYDHPLAGSKVWGPQVFDDVPVVNGRFNVILGAVDNNFPPKSLTAAFGDQDRYLGFKVGASGADLSAIAEIAPRQKILSAPYAIQAENASDAVHANEADHAAKADDTDSQTPIGKRLANLENFVIRSRPAISGPHEPPGGDWGNWTGARWCPDRQYVCGIELRVEGNVGGGDDTAQNGLRFWCCPL